MPYDSFGNFTREYNWTADKLNGIKIESERMDGEFDNYATGMNQVLLRSGVAPLQGDLKMGGFKVTGLGAGLVASPSLQFQADPTTGLYLVAPGNIGITTNGVERARATPAGLIVFGQLDVTGNISGTFVGALAPLSVDTGEIADGAVTGQKMAPNSVDSTKWVVGAPYVAVNSGFVLNNGSLAAAATRWTTALSGAEGGGNAGMDFSIVRHSNTGVALASPILINRATGRVAIGEGLSCINGSFLRTCASNVGYLSAYVIDNNVRWSWSIETSAFASPNALTLNAYTAAGAYAATLVTYNLQNFSATHGLNTEHIFTRGTSGGLTGSNAIRFTGDTPGMIFNPGGGAQKLAVVLANSSETLHFVRSTNVSAFTFDGLTGIGTATTWTSLSDSRLKSDITPLVGGLDDIAGLQAYTYLQATSEEDALDGIGVFSAGVLAQDLIGTPLEGLVLPPVPGADESPGYYSFNYTGLTAWYIAAFKEIKTRLDDIEARLDAAGL